MSDAYKNFVEKHGDPWRATEEMAQEWTQAASSRRRYWGLYCEQCGIWWVRPDNSRLVFYPAPELANAHLRDRGWLKSETVHLWKVQEFGKEEHVSPENAKPNTAICPVWLQTRAK